jgi:proteasome accessory factor B
MAMNKIGFAADADAGGPSPLRVLPANRMEQPAALRRSDYLETLRRAISGRKNVILFYHGLWRNEQTRRTVDPYGLACTRGTWFLVGHCHLRDAVRVFHVDRITGLEVNRFKPKTPDFDFPSDFRLSDHVTKHPWELRVHEPLEVTLRVQGPIADVFTAELGSGLEVVDEDHQSRAVKLTATHLEGLLPTILWYREKVRVLDPPELIEKVTASLRRLSAEAP